MTLYGLMGYIWLQLKERTQSEERAENPGPHVGRRLQANGKTTKKAQTHVNALLCVHVCSQYPPHRRFYFIYFLFFKNWNGPRQHFTQECSPAHERPSQDWQVRRRRVQRDLPPHPFPQSLGGITHAWNSSEILNDKTIFCKGTFIYFWGDYSYI